MSYEIAKSIKIDEQNNNIILQCASNNVYPKHWYKGEYYPEAPSFKAKMIALLCDVDGYSYQCFEHDEDLYTIETFVSDKAPTEQELQNIIACVMES